MFAISAMIIFAQADSPPLIGLYIICLMIGGGLLLVSLLFGGHGDGSGGHLGDLGAHGDLSGSANGLFHGTGPFGDHIGADSGGHFETAAAGAGGAHAVGHGAGVGHSAGAHGVGIHGSGALSLAAWISVTFVIYFLAVFGAIGTTLSYFSDYSPRAVLLSALIPGIAVGQGVHQLIRRLRRGSVDGSLGSAEVVGKAGRVVVAVVPPHQGQIAIQVRDGERFLPARARHERDRFEKGTTVFVETYAAGMAEVVGEEEHRFLNPDIV